MTVVIDIGGTSIKYGVFQDGALTQTGETPSFASQGGEKLMEVAVQTVRNIATQNNMEPSMIGISTSGQVDTAAGTIRYAGPTIPNYTGFNVKGIFQSAFKRAGVKVLNDVHAAATGEAAFGAGQGVGDFLCLTYGTGVGGAIILDGKVYGGANGSAGEFGQIVTHSEVPNGQGFYERYAAVSILVANVQKVLPQVENGRQIFEHINNPAVKTVVEAWIHEVLCGLSTLSHIFNPKLIVLGGGIMANPYIIDTLERYKLDYLVPGLNNVTLKTAQLGNYAALWGMGAVVGERQFMHIS